MTCMGIGLIKLLKFCRTTDQDMEFTGIRTRIIRPVSRRRKLEPIMIPSPAPGPRHAGSDLIPQCLPPPELENDNPQPSTADRPAEDTQEHASTTGETMTDSILDILKSVDPDLFIIF